VLVEFARSEQFNTGLPHTFVASTFPDAAGISQKRKTLCHLREARQLEQLMGCQTKLWRRVRSDIDVDKWTPVSDKKNSRTWFECDIPRD
jgi:hypothetical protein